jgi:hypothetical protein
VKITRLLRAIEALRFISTMLAPKKIGPAGQLEQILTRGLADSTSTIGTKTGEVAPSGACA